jgi:hypothetical protein
MNQEKKLDQMSSETSIGEEERVNKHQINALENIEAL